MSPSTANNNKMNSSATYTIVLSKFIASCITLCVQCANFTHLRFGQFSLFIHFAYPTASLGIRQRPRFILRYSVLPVISFDNATYAAPSNAESFGKIILCHVASGIKRANLFDLFKRQLGTGNAFASCPALWMRLGTMRFTTATGNAPLIQAILHIVFFCSQKQMIGIAANRVVATMTNQATFRVYSIVEIVRDTMTLQIFPVNFNLSVSSRELTVFPRPAFMLLSDMNVAPKAVNINLVKNGHSSVMHKLAFLFHTIIISRWNRMSNYASL